MMTLLRQYQLDYNVPCSGRLSYRAPLEDHVLTQAANSDHTQSNHGKREQSSLARNTYTTMGLMKTRNDVLQHVLSKIPVIPQANPHTLQAMAQRDIGTQNR